MSRFDLLKAKVVLDGEEILSVEGQINHYIIQPHYHVLITEVKCAEGVEPPYNRFDRDSFSDFTDRLYTFKLSIDEKTKFRNYSHMEIKLKKVDAITD